MGENREEENRKDELRNIHKSMKSKVKRDVIMSWLAHWYEYAEETDCCLTNPSLPLPLSPGFLHSLAEG